MNLKKRKYYFHEIEWYCAFRERKHDFLDLNDKTPFKIVKCQKNHWAADPFLFSENGKDIYLFVELMNTKKSKSVIGVKKIYPEEEPSFHQIIEIEGHVSYPCIFKQKDSIYMIPETCFNKTIQLFKCISFPYKWNKISILSNEHIFVDSTYFSTSGESYLFLFEQFCASQETKLYITNLDLNNCLLKKRTLIKSTKESLYRPGGSVISDGSSLIRVVQPSNVSYGERLEFWKFQFVNGSYKDSLIKMARVSDLNILSKMTFVGTHTYNCFKQIEIIDLKRLKFSPFKLIKYLFKKMKIFGYGLYEKTGEMINEK